MKNITLLVLILALLHLATPWCLKTTVNLTAAVTKVDFSPDGLWIAVTSSTDNKVYIYDTTNYFLNTIYTPTTSNVNVARWSKDGAYIAIGHANGKIDFLNGASPFANAAISITPSNKNIIDLDFNWNNNMLMICYSDDNSFRILDAYNGAQTSRLRDTGDKQISCRFSKNNVAVVARINKEIRTYAIPAAGNAINDFVTKVKGDLDWTDVAVKPVTTTPVKIVASGGNNAQDGGSYFTNSGTNN